MPVITPFNCEDESINYKGLEKNIKYINGTDVSGYMLLGSNGEYASLSEDESLKITEVAAKIKSNNKMLLVGASKESVYSTTEFIKKIAHLGAEIAFVQPPNYFSKQITDSVMVRYYTEVADKSPIPILLYNSPAFCNQVNIYPKVAAELAKHDNIVGMKQTSAIGYNQYEPVLRETSNFSFLVGSLSIYLDSIRLGASGAVLSFANFMPAEATSMHRILSSQVKISKDYTVERLFTIVSDMNSAISGDYGVAGVKAAMDIMGLTGNSPRLPIGNLSEKQKMIIAKVLRKFCEEF